MEHLVFQLYGPMAAWGEIAVGERRASSAQTVEIGHFRIGGRCARDSSRRGGTAPESRGHLRHGGPYRCTRRVVA